MEQTSPLLPGTDSPGKETGLKKIDPHSYILTNYDKHNERRRWDQEEEIFCIGKLVRKTSKNNLIHGNLKNVLLKEKRKRTHYYMSSSLVSFT